MRSLLAGQVMPITESSISGARQLLPLDSVLFLEPFAESVNVCRVSRTVGFTRIYQAFGGEMEGTTQIDVDGNVVSVSARHWLTRRERWVRKQVLIGLSKDPYGELDSPWWLQGKPSRRHLALSMWAASPTPDRLHRWIKSAEKTEQMVWRAMPCPF